MIGVSAAYKRPHRSRRFNHAGLRADFRFFGVSSLDAKHAGISVRQAASHSFGAGSISPLPRLTKFSTNLPLTSAHFTVCLVQSDVAHYSKYPTFYVSNITFFLR